MTDISYVGWWGMRQGGKWHLIESEVVDRLVTRCGRQMKMELASGIMVFEIQPSGDACFLCTGHLVAA